MSAIDKSFEFEVVIAGTGPAGLTLANLLGRAGISTLVVEKNPGLSDQPKALNIDDEFFRLLHAMGLGDALRDHGKYPIDFVYRSPMGYQIGYVQGRETEHNFPNRTAIFQPEFERILYRQALTNECVRIVFDRELVSFLETADGVAVSARNAAGELFDYRARYLASAEGSHSVCRKALGIPFNEVAKFGVRHLVIDVVDDPDTGTRALTQLGWNRNFISMPAPNGRRYEFSLREGEDVERMLQDDVLEQLFKPFHDYRSMKVIRKVGHTFHARIAERMSKGRVFLVGDAAHVMPVFGSQGMNSGARDANNLAWKLQAVLRYAADASVLDSYHSERWGQVIETIRISTINGQIQRVRPWPVAFLRDAFLGIANLFPPVRRYIRDMRYIPRPFLRSKLVFHTGETGRPNEVVGRVLANPLVRHEEKALRLDDLMLTGGKVGFGLVGVGVNAEQQFQLQHDPFWAKLQASVLSVHGRGEFPAAGTRSPGLQVEVLDERFQQVLAQYRGKWLVVRPDRIVAAAVSITGLDAVARQLMETLGKDLRAPLATVGSDAIAA